MERTIDGSRFILSARTLENHQIHKGAVFTLTIPDAFQTVYKVKNSHFTYKVKMERSEDGVNESWYCLLLTGPDNSNSYTYMGVLNPNTGEFSLTPKSGVTNDAWSVRMLKRTLACMWKHDGASLEDMDRSGFYVMHCGKCGRCGRKLTVPESLKNGLGPICANKGLL